MGGVINQEARRVLEGRRVNEMSQRTLETVKEIDELDQWAKQEVDFEKIVPAYENKIIELRLRQREIQDPAVKKQFGRQFEKLAVRSLSFAKDLARGKENNHNQAMIGVRLNEYSNMIGSAENFQKASSYMKYMKGEIAGAVAAGTIDELRGVEIEKEFLDKSFTNFVRRDMFFAPRETYAGLLAGQYEGLDEISRTGLMKEAKNMVTALHAQELADQEHRDKQARQKLRDYQDSVYGELLVMKDKKLLTAPYVYSLIHKRSLDPDKARGLLRELGDEAKGEKPGRRSFFRRRLGRPDQIRGGCYGGAQGRCPGRQDQDPNFYRFPGANFVEKFSGRDGLY